MKRGISLIAVLMFMLAATTASIVVFRMLSSEGFSSGARLKASEAYQRSESGIDAVRNWLANRGTEAGDLVTQYTSPDYNPDKKPIEIKFNGLNDSVKAYVIGVGAPNGTNGNQPIKLKILVEGKGRDNSVVTQTAILSVKGLYKKSGLPENTPCPDCYSSDGGGSSGSGVSSGSNGEITITAICDGNSNSTGCKKNLPDLWGNLATAGFISSRTMIITQTPDFCNGGGQALNTIQIGTNKEPGYLILDGDYYTNNGIMIYGDLYATGTFDFCASGADFITGNVFIKKAFHPRVSTGTLSIGGSAYFADSVNPNVFPKKVCDPLKPPSQPVQLGCQGQLGGMVKIGGNTTIMKPYLAYRADEGGGSLEFNIGGSLVMGDDSYILVDSDGKKNQSSKKFQTQQLEVGKNVWIKKFSPTPTISNYGKDELVWPLFGRSSTSQLCLPNASQEPGPGNPATYKSGNFYFKTYASSTNGCGAAKDDWNASKMEELAAEISDGTGQAGPGAGPGSNTNMRSCNRPPVEFDTTAIYLEAKKPASSVAAWVHKDGKPGSCPANNNNLSMSAGWSDLLKDLNTCWNKKSSSDLYKDEWFVIYIKNQHRYEEEKMIGNLGKGKYVIIFDFDKNYNTEYYDFLYLPPTGPDAYVMLYLPNGFPGTIQLGKNESGKAAQLSKYNYFIFSNGDIGQFTTTKDRKLSGNVFMNNCATINSNLQTSTNPYFYSEGNDAFVDLLMNANILKNTEYACVNRPGNSNTTSYDLTCKATLEKATEGKKINLPTKVSDGKGGECNVKAVKNGSEELNREKPTAGTYTVSITCTGNCKDKTVNCGTLTVNAAPSSSSVASSSSFASSNSSGNSSNSNQGFDPAKEPWIPISSRLKVTLESKEISKEKIKDHKPLDKSILVMPRVVMVAPGTNLSGDTLRKYYSYMPLNGAKRSDTTQSLPVCHGDKPDNTPLNWPTDEGVYTCEFYNDASKPKHSSFYVLIGNPPEGSDNFPKTPTCKIRKKGGIFKDGSVTFTQGENLKFDITCGDSKHQIDPSKAEFIPMGVVVPKWTSNDGTGYFGYFEALDQEKSGNLMIADICEGENETLCEPELTIKKPTCKIGGTWYSICTKSGYDGDCTSTPFVPPPTHDCGNALEYPEPAGTPPPKFNYSAENDGEISKTDPTWNRDPPEAHTFGNLGLQRVIRMYEVSCDGNRLSYGTRTGNGIVCGTIDVKKLGASGSPSFGNSICEDLNFCGGRVSLANIMDNTTTKPTVGQCVFVKDYSAINTSSQDATVLINGIVCAGKSINCVSSITKPDPIDGGYYIYVLSGKLADNSPYDVTPGKKPDCSSVTQNLTCGSVPSTGTVGVAITPPVVNCGSLSLPSNYLDWKYAPDWDDPVLGTYSGISVTANAGNCLGKSASCNGTLTVSNTATAICELKKGTVTLGEKLGKPAITCSNGAASDIEAAHFSGGPAGGDWKDGSAYFASYQSIGESSIRVSGVKCGGVTINGNTDCKFNGSNINVIKPTCSGVSGTLSINQTVTPTVSCGNATKSGTPTFSGNDWSPNGSGGGSFTVPGKKTLNLSSVTCDNNLISDISDVSCGTGIVQTTTCASLITYPVPNNGIPSDPYTACFKYTNNKCYVCKVENESGNNTCRSSWVWNGSQIASNLTNGYWYLEVPCPGSSGGTTPSCSISGTYYLGSSGCVNVPTPSVSGCTSPSNLIFRIESTSGTIPGGSNGSAGWNGVSVGSNGSFCNPRTNTSVWMTQAYCNGSSANLGGGINCGTITIASSGSTGGSSSSSSGGGGSGGTINLATVSATVYGAGEYTLTGGKTQCNLDCASNSCSITGAISASCSGGGGNYCGIGNKTVSTSQNTVTITGSIKFNSCW